MSHTDPQYPQQPSSGDASASSPSAYPSARYEPPGGGWPADPPPSRPSGLAVAAFVIGLVSALLCLIPIVNAVSVLGGIAAVVVGILAVRKLVPGGQGKGFAITGIVLGALSALIAIAMWIAITLAIVSYEDLETTVDDASGAPSTVVAPA